MTYKASELSVLAYANGFTLWHYKGDDSPGTQKGSNFFNDAYDVLRIGDVIMSDRAGLLRVKTKSSGAIVVEAYS
ncbi:MAG: hypothetical protein GDA50_02500 [Alphaproteobacteria bacterium GM202ARS2]|nr:hypothetical protein [Alphaproteobacteria bacterium GM202ARS2]